VVAENIFSRVRSLHVVADAVGDVGEAEKLRALEAAQQSDFLIIMFDAIQGIKKTGRELFTELTSLDKPFPGGWQIEGDAM
jgi:hypothetical protein